MKWKPYIVLTLFAWLLSACQAEVEQLEDGYYENGAYYYWSGQKGLGQLENGRKNGVWEFYDVDRLLISRGPFQDNIMQGPWEFYFPDGKLKRNGSFENDREEGLWQYWYPNGQQTSEGKLTQGARTGTWVFWYPDGKVQEIRIFKLGKNYLLKSWNPQGELRVDEGTGPYEYWDNGILREQGQYQDSLAEGNWTFFGPNGEKTGESIYHKGVRQRVKP